MTFQERLQNKIKEAQVAKQEANNAAMEKLLENDNFIEAQRELMAKEEELTRLKAIITQLNKIKPFVATDGTKYSVSVYPVSFFGTGIGEIIGIINGAKSAFTDDLALQYSAITGISMLELTEASNALGVPAYYSNKEMRMVDGIEGNISIFKGLLDSIMLKLNITEFKNTITEERIKLWFARAELNATKKETEVARNIILDDNNDFTMED